MSWEAWRRKAEGLQQKYASMDRILRSELQNLSPRIFSRYDARRSLYYLFLLSRLKRAQEQLYTRFKDGIEFFMPRIEQDVVRNYAEQVRDTGKKLVDDIRQERKVLYELNAEFEVLRKTIGRSELQRFFSGAKSAESLVEEMRAHAPKNADSIKRVHKRILDDERDGSYHLHRMQKLAKGLGEDVKTFYYTMGQNEALKKAAFGLYVTSFIISLVGVSMPGQLKELPIKSISRQLSGV